jgi:hypothetical protein
MLGFGEGSLHFTLKNEGKVNGVQVQKDIHGG